MGSLACGGVVAGDGAGAEAALSTEVFIQKVGGKRERRTAAMCVSREPLAAGGERGRGLEDAQDWHVGEAPRVAGGARGGQEAGGLGDA